MPYIKPVDRAELDPTSLGFKRDPCNAGELNFVITRICDEYLRADVSYRTLNEVIGVLECAKLELYRRLAAPYEDQKLKDNGDVYVNASS